MYKTFLKLGVTALLAGSVSVVNAEVLTFNNFINDTTQQVGYDYFSVAQDGTDVTLAVDAPSLDSMMYLFEYDNVNSTIGAYISHNDDSNGGLDPLINFQLLHGNYVAAVSKFLLEESEARSGLINNAEFALYDLTVTGNGVSKLAVAAVPEPEAYAMFLAGLGLLGFAARRKQA